MFRKSTLIASLIALSTPAYAQSYAPFESEYQRDTFCAAATVFVRLVGDTGINGPALDHWLRETTKEGTRLNYSQAHNRETVDQMTLYLEKTMADGHASNIAGAYDKACLLK